ncbi:MAG: 23S rRNA (adenine(2030)-N(6))-methyltransferase RlmJ [Proteobacteria bacterium]|nr:23S rRNA (adenine(2030)-N(6))-methyltransferase RlmJ [Pseudomonadota bacterium]
MSLSYQHIYHAGNFADIHKHLWLIAVIEHLGNKEKPFFWLDTHAGRGVYDLYSPEAQKTKEGLNGIGKVLKLFEKSDNPLLVKYKTLIDELNSDKTTLQFYPGSGYLVASLLREQDRMTALELHPQEIEHLKLAMDGFGQVSVKYGDMSKLISGFLPPKERRGGVLIDPSFEIKSEYESQARLLMQSVKKWSTGVFMLWYPLLPQRHHERLKEILRDAQLMMTVDEWVFENPSKAIGMYGSGMIVVNSPYTAAEKVKRALSILEKGINKG